MNNAIFIRETNIPELNLLKSFIDTMTTVIVSDPNDVMNLKGIKTVGLLYMNNRYNYIPIMSHSPQYTFKINQKYIWYSQLLINYFKQLKQNGVEQVDLITCRLNNLSFIKETKQLSDEIGIKIEYSTNQTGIGNDADWILESNNTNLIGTMFKPDVTLWKHKLDSFITFVTPSEILPFFNTSGSVLPMGSLTYHNGCYELTHDVTISEMSYFGHIQIQLNNGETFNGHNHKITINYAISGFFAIYSSSLSTTIKNLSYVINADNVDDNTCLISSNMNHFTVKHCNIITTDICTYAGSICDGNCSNFVVKHCTNRCSAVINRANGGICNMLCANGVITHCSNYSPLGQVYKGPYDPSAPGYGDLNGGIVGSLGHNMIIKNCKNHGNILGINSGGIVGGMFGYDNFSITPDVNNVYSSDNVINHCTNYGQIYGQNSGGIVGGYMGFVYGQIYKLKRHDRITIKKCVNKGKIMGSDIGGICGSFCGFSFYSLMDITDKTIWDPSYKYDTNEKIKFNKCYTKYGSLISNYCFFSFADVAALKIIGPSLHIIDSYTKEKLRVIAHFYYIVYSNDVKYIKGSKQINLLKHQAYIAHK